MRILDGFMPHGMCYAWRPDILWLNVASDAAIGIAYFTIPVVLFHFLRRRTDAPFRSVVVMFSVFIFACGTTHFMSIVTVWNGYYGVQGLLKAVTAFASIATAVMLYPLVPRMLALRSPAELEASNDALELEIENRKRTEIQSMELQNELAHMGRLTTMGQMATGLAHELNQPLLAISQSADTAKLTAGSIHADDAELLECLDDIQVQTQRAGEIIRALRQFMSKDTANRSALNLNELIRQTIQLIMPDARKHNVKIVAQLGPVSAEPKADRVQIAQVLVNILRNSVDSIVGANSEKRQVTVKARHDSDEITVVIEDSGPGLAESVEPFKAFESSKAHGMGMGLSISRSIIESHGGRLWFDEAMNSGARILFSLPMDKR